ncbi:hypothetical protein [Actibacterium pelagium]|uniref:Membrane protein n=1 Tax=Actibacterium pelagium TaxID=2029103 RepID=A0A917AHF7_9RHOB|nr:hypothetical protein [Actibacterium pelagium]GGE53234.1 membrane protein [Actibacterium pelagium]
MNGSIVFAPLLPWLVIWIACALAVVFTGWSLWRGQSGWWLRGLTAVALLMALANPSLQIEERSPLSDIVLLVVDDSASQSLSDRPDQTEDAIAAVQAEVNALPNTELRIVRFEDGEDNSGSLMMAALNQALAELPRARIAGTMLLSDGQVHDMDFAPEVGFPIHALLTGRQTDWDRRLIIKNAPAFAIIDEQLTLTLRIEDQGDVPLTAGGLVPLRISVDGGEEQVVQVPLNRDMEVPVTLQHGGTNVLQFTVDAAEGELTDRNNSAVVRINGVRDRLNVLLVSGEPHAGERTWRNLLKSDSSVDLVHFTILRPPEKQDGVPVTELSLIAFPTRELFLEKIDEFDLIIFDRYKRRGILPMLYLENVRDYVEQGGAVLIAAGPDFASASSLYRSPLAAAMPAAPTARVVEEAFRPEVTPLGERHPVTQGLSAETPDGEANWGRWFRLVELEALGGQTVMSGVGDRPLLVLDRVGEGRVALLASDHAWLWSRGYEGGGPQLELLRRLAHWMMKEPDLEEEALTALAEGQQVRVLRRTLEEAVPDVMVTAPDGSTFAVTPEEVSPGQFAANFTAPGMGLYRLTDGIKEAVIVVGPAAPKEFEDTIATTAMLEPLVAAQRGGAMVLEAGFPDIRRVREGRVAAGRGWIGVTPREAYVTQGISLTALAPAWLMLLIAAMLSVGAWLYEGRR